MISIRKSNPSLSCPGNLPVMGLSSVRDNPEGNRWSQLSDSNRQPLDYKSRALPIEAKLADRWRAKYARLRTGRKSGMEGQPSFV